MFENVKGLELADSVRLRNGVHSHSNVQQAGKVVKHDLRKQLGEQGGWREVRRRHLDSLQALTAHCPGAFLQCVCGLMCQRRLVWHRQGAPMSFAHPHRARGLQILHQMRLHRCDGRANWKQNVCDLLADLHATALSAARHGEEHRHEYNGGTKSSDTGLYHNRGHPEAPTIERVSVQLHHAASCQNSFMGCVLPTSQMSLSLMGGSEAPRG
jgi:hypothetical protein